MTEDEFFALPPAIALRVLFDCLDEPTVGALKAAPVRTAPRRPKYDTQIYRQTGFQWASETDRESILWWRNRAKESAARGGKYAESNAKRAAQLDRWIAWREWYPELAWTGLRGEDEEITAVPPSAWPKVHQRAENGPPRASKPRDDDTSFDPDTF